VKLPLWLRRQAPPAAPARREQPRPSSQWLPWSQPWDAPDAHSRRVYLTMALETPNDGRVAAARRAVSGAIEGLIKTNDRPGRWSHVRSEEPVTLPSFYQIACVPRR
jgi:hypothetical protein